MHTARETSPRAALPRPRRSPLAAVLVLLLAGACAPSIATAASEDEAAAIEEEAAALAKAPFHQGAAEERFLRGLHWWRRLHERGGEVPPPLQRVLNHLGPHLRAQLLADRSPSRHARRDALTTLAAAYYVALAANLGALRTGRPFPSRPDPSFLATLAVRFTGPTTRENAFDRFATLFLGAYALAGTPNGLRSHAYASAHGGMAALRAFAFAPPPADLEPSQPPAETRGADRPIDFAPDAFLQALEEDLRRAREVAARHLAAQAPPDASAPDPPRGPRPLVALLLGALFLGGLLGGAALIARRGRRPRAQAEPGTPLRGPSTVRDETTPVETEGPGPPPPADGSVTLPVCDPAQLARHLPARYTQVEKIGQGGMGVVFKAWDRALKRAVACKMLLPLLAEGRKAVARFLAEARILAELNHPGILRLYDVEAEPWPYITTEYLEGTPLDARIRQGPLSDAEFFAVAIPLTAAVAFAHQRGILHRDIKPANVMVCADGAVKVMDFGLARVAEQTGLTSTNVVLGSPLYLPPEVILGQVAGFGADIYALGLTLYEALARSLPFPPDQMEAKLGGVPVLPECLGLPRGKELAPVLVKALETSPHHRYETAQAFHDALLAARGRILGFRAKPR